MILIQSQSNVNIVVFLFVVVKLVFKDKGVVGVLGKYEIIMIVVVNNNVDMGLQILWLLFCFRNIGFVFVYVICISDLLVEVVIVYFEQYYNFVIIISSMIKLCCFCVFSLILVFFLYFLCN